MNICIFLAYKCLFTQLLRSSSVKPRWNLQFLLCEPFSPPLYPSSKCPIGISFVILFCYMDFHPHVYNSIFTPWECRRFDASFLQKIKINHVGYVLATLERGLTCDYIRSEECPRRHTQSASSTKCFFVFSAISASDEPTSNIWGYTYMGYWLDRGNNTLMWKPFECARARACKHKEIENTGIVLCVQHTVLIIALSHSEGNKPMATRLIRRNRYTPNKTNPAGDWLVHQ